MNYVLKNAGDRVWCFLNTIDLIGIRFPTAAKINYVPLDDLAVYFEEISR